jgi:hypothetical protein
MPTDEQVFLTYHRETHMGLPTSCDAPSNEENRTEILHLLNNKAAGYGPDNYCAKIDTSLKLLYPLFQKL